MSGISAAAVKQLRERTGLPMMDCKQALAEAHGDADAAVDILRKRGAQIFAKRSDRETDFGRMGIFAGLDRDACAMVEVKCESDPVAATTSLSSLPTPPPSNWPPVPAPRRWTNFWTSPRPRNPG